MDGDVATAGEILGTCRLVFVGRTVQFSRLAVRHWARRRRIAATLLEAADAEARRGRARRLVLHAQTYAQALYEQAGYVTRGNVFREAGIEHVAMEKELE
jgi:predicted GNAT family N-acyltransferase